MTGLARSTERPEWIIGPRGDLCWISGSLGLAFLAIAAYHLLQIGGSLSAELAVGALYLAWTLIFDGTHFFATYSRTFGDPSFRRSRGALLYGSMIVFAIGPAAIAAAYAQGGTEAARAASIVFNRVALTWAYLHLCRQHWGLITLYGRKAGDMLPSVRRLEAALVACGFAAPYAVLLARSTAPLSLAETFFVSQPIWDQLAARLAMIGSAGLLLALVALSSGQSARAKGLTRTAGWAGALLLALAACTTATSWSGLGTALERLGFVSGGAAIGLGVAALGWEYARRGRVNVGKWALMLAALGTHNAVLLWDGLPIALQLIALTLAHNVQYHRIVWLHNVAHARGSAGPVDGSDAESTAPPEPPRLSRMRVYLTWALAFSALYGVLRLPVVWIEGRELLLYAYVAFAWGVPMHHYVLDGVIWRPSRSRALRVRLGLDPGSGGAASTEANMSLTSRPARSPAVRV